MKIVSWNVNSVAARRERLLGWLARHTPDVLCLQELKAVDEAFPTAEVEALGYHVVTHGQRTYNGVAILARSPISDVERGLPGDDSDVEARFIVGAVDGVRVASCYIPNGQEQTSAKFAYKLRWLDRLIAHLGGLVTPDVQLAVCGDFNIAPEDRDCYDPAGLVDDVLCHREVRAHFEALRALGFVDTFRKHVPDAGKYSWWDYRQLAFPKGRGLRIDFVLASPALARRCTAAAIDRKEREGEQPSDHAPVIAEFA
jgi:exodeoxyribonuclease III